MIKFDANGVFQSTITAEYGYWRDSSDKANPFGKNGWVVYNGAAYVYEKNGIRKNIGKFGQEGYYLETSLTPIELERSDKSLTYMALSEIRELIKTYPHRTYLKMKLYNKFVVPISILIILLLGMPFVMMSESNNFFIGIGICLIINILFFATQFFFGNLGNQGIISPFLASIIPIALFALTGLHFLRKIRT
jgi:lipopolysaccharide export system permease protein